MVIITGASSGIGEACARAFAAGASETGKTMGLIARRGDRIEKLAGELKAKHGVQVFTWALDISDRAAVEKWAADPAVTAQISKAQVLVNNAGLARGLDPLQDGNPSDWDEMIDTNVKGLLYMTKVCLPHLIRNRGHIVMMSSVAARWLYPKGNVYAATKAAVHALSEGLRLDLHGTGVRVTEISPGMVETEFSDVRFHGDAKRANEVYATTTPLTPEDVAETVVWSCARPAHVNIQELVVYPTAQASPTTVLRRT